jgi:hypothetical protein
LPGIKVVSHEAVCQEKIVLHETPIVQMFKGSNLEKVLDNFAEKCIRRELSIDINGAEGHEVYVAFKDQEFMGSFDMDAKEGYLLVGEMLAIPEGSMLH